MKQKLLFLLVIVSSPGLRAQISVNTISPQDLPNMIPGYSQIGTINTKTLSFTYSLQPDDPNPIDGDTLTESGDVFKYGERLSVNYNLQMEIIPKLQKKKYGRLG